MFGKDNELERFKAKLVNMNIRIDNLVDQIRTIKDALILRDSEEPVEDEEDYNEKLKYKSSEL